MSFGVNSNIQSLTAQRHLTKNQDNLSTAMHRLSSGKRINSAKDDAAGLAISERFEAQIRGNRQAQKNAQDGVSMLQTAEGALEEITQMLHRMREISVQGANTDIYTDDAKKHLLREFESLGSEMRRTVTTTKFNGFRLLGSAARAFSFQVGATNKSAQVIQVNFSIAHASYPNGGQWFNFFDHQQQFIPHTVSTIATLDGTLIFGSAIGAIDAVIDQVTTLRARLGAVQNRFSHTISNLRNTEENLSASKGRIVDADFAKESARLSRHQVLQQAGTAMLAQANQAPQQVLSLIR